VNRGKAGKNEYWMDSRRCGIIRNCVSKKECGGKQEQKIGFGELNEGIA
jgi:hypothetical protein